MDDLEKRFAFHPADTELRRNKHEYVRAVMRQVADSMDVSLPEGREKALVLTKLEEAMFWANAAIAREGK